MGALTIHDIFRNGRVLLAREDLRREMLVRVPGETKDRDLSWLDYPGLMDLSEDGKGVLFGENGEAGGERWVAYFAKTDGSTPIRLGEGTAMRLSSDSRHALVFPGPTERNKLLIIPIGPGEPRQIEVGMDVTEGIALLPEDKGILFQGVQAPGRNAIFLQDTSKGRPRPVAAATLKVDEELAVSPDGRLFAARDERGRLMVWPTEGGSPRPIPGLEKDDRAMRWSRDGRSLFVSSARDELPIRVFRVDLQDGNRQLVTMLTPSDTTGVRYVWNLSVTGDGQGYAYNYIRRLCDLYLVEGLR
jgi:hypothetical protein